MRKFLALSAEDEQLLLHLHQHIYLSRDFIEKYIYVRKDDDAKKVKAHELSVFRRLNQLVKEGYLTKFALPITPGSGRSSNVYTLAQFGVETVENLTGIVHWNKRWSHQPQIWYMHALTLAQVIKSYEVNANPEVIEVKQFISEAKGYFEYYEKEDAKIKTHRIRPDGILIIGQPGTEDRNLGIMVEMERSYADKTGTIRKLNQYNHFFGGVGGPKHDERMKKFDADVGLEHPVVDWRILFIGDSDSLGKRILTQLKGQKSEKPILAASKDDLLKKPYGNVYRSLMNPDTLKSL